MTRIVSRFSCGAASAVATKLTIAKYGLDRVEISYSDPGSEHPDNQRFLADCERWFGKAVVVHKSEKYENTWAVWQGERFIKSAQGAPCTGILKREPKYAWDRPDDVLVFGYTVEEKDRADRLREQNFERIIETPLIDAGLTKADCLGMLERAGIALPAMYLLGFQNNNCIGCPKGGMGYWNMIRKHFPEAFAKMAALQRELGPGSYLWQEEDGSRLSLDDLSPTRGDQFTEPNIECSIMCHIAEQEMAE